MTTRQKLLKNVYPFWMLLQKISNKKEKIFLNKENKRPLSSFYDLNFILNDEVPFSFEQLKGKNILLVNTASDCIYTNQYTELEALYQQYRHQLNILAFPTNDFSEQEKDDDKNIAAFCNENFNISFQLMKKSVVSKKTNQNIIYQWLTDSTKNGWNDKSPIWNFSKYLVNKEGILTHYFSPEVSPLSKEILKALE